MRTRFEFEDDIRLRSQRLADLKDKTAELERELFDARVSLERELAQPADGWTEAPGPIQQTHRRAALAAEGVGPGHPADRMSAGYAAAEPAYGYRGPDYDGQLRSPEGRTEVLVNHGRSSAYYPRFSRGLKAAIGTAVVAALVTILVMRLPGAGASWPSSVAKVQREAARACQNPDVKSEPGQVDFACARGTRQFLWVFALMTSSDNPDFADRMTGRLGLEPITPAQGGAVAWSLNLHQPYNPSNPIDSLEVAARAINNIVGGATLTGKHGNPVVQPGLESNSANCLRYTGSAAVTSRAGFPSVCARPVNGRTGQAALVADVYQKWIVGAPDEAAREAAVLFENANNPGDPRVQAILKHLSQAKLEA